MDAQTLRRALYDFFKFNPKDFYVQASGSGYLVSGVKKAATTGAVTPPRGLEFSVVTVDDVDTLGVYVGTINGVMPTDMFAGGIPLKTYDFPADADTGYIFAKATFLESEWQWTSSDIYLQEDPTIDNTDTVAYLLMGTWATNGTTSKKFTTQEIFGPVTIEISELDWA